MCCGFRVAKGRLPHMLGADGDWKASSCGPTRLDPRGAHWGRNDPWLHSSWDEQGPQETQPPCPLPGLQAPCFVSPSRSECLRPQPFPSA